MFGNASTIATTILSGALVLGGLTGAPIATAAPVDNGDDLQVQEYAMSDTFSCDYYHLPWCRR